MILAVLIAAIGTVALYPVFRDRAANSYVTDQAILDDGLLREFSTGSFVLYMEAREVQDSQKYSPSELFLSKGYSGSESQYGSYEVNEVEYLSSKQSLAAEINQTVYMWQDNFENVRTLLEYAVYDQSGELLVTNTRNSNLKSFISSNSIPKNPGKYAAVIAMNYDSIGDLTAQQYDGNQQENTVNVLERYNRENSLLGEYSWESAAISQPSDITIVYAIPENSNLLTANNDWNTYLSYSESGFSVWYLMLLIGIAVIAFVLPFFKSLYINDVKILKIPLEIALAAIVSICGLYNGILYMVISTNSGTFLQPLTHLISSPPVSSITNFIINVVVWILVLGIWYIAVESMHSVVIMGPKNYLKNRTLIGRFCIWLKIKVKSFIASMAEIDLSEQSNKLIFKIVLINFFILSLFCTIWLFGMGAVLIYSIVIYFLLKKYAGEAKKQYEILLKATNAMAEGNLDIVIEDDLGLFNSFKKELKEIQIGFKIALEKEVASQNMKTELITNVSHDLKTPLTAIITYVDLLKNVDITEEERRNHIEIIDNKSMRLKALIEDLFEVSKADSKNVTLQLIHVDLIDLVKQVYYELADKISEAELDFRLNLPDRKVVLYLDSQKTYRIFENLFTNCIKYALKGTRVYVDFEETDSEVKVIYKNMSATELNFPPDKLTERFIRGDLARNTEGSGLGLAIAKSFIELQGGRLDIEIDGDLFKVTTRFRISSN